MSRVSCKRMSSTAPSTPASPKNRASRPTSPPLRVASSRAPFSKTQPPQGSTGKCCGSSVGAAGAASVAAAIKTPTGAIMSTILPLRSSGVHAILWKAWVQRCTGLSTPCGLAEKVPARSGRTINRLRPNSMGTCVLFRCKRHEKDMSGAHLPTDGNMRTRVVHSERVTTVAQLAEAAPIAPPQNLEAEESVLGAMLLSPGAIGAVSEVLDASDFYRESHAKIYRAAVGLYTKGEPVDAITLVDELEERGELEDSGGRVRLHELAALVPATANAAHYARIVREMATLRGLIAAGQQIAQLGWERPGETQMLVDRAAQVVFELSQSRISTGFSHLA